MRCGAWSGSGPTCFSPTPDVRRGREALAALDFYVHADLFMNRPPSWPMSCCRSPPLRAEGLKIGFDIGAAAQSLGAAAAARGRAARRGARGYRDRCSISPAVSVSPTASGMAIFDAAQRHQLGPSE